jgi:hypothetical protein
MKNKLSTSTTLVLVAGTVALVAGVWTNIFSNSLMLLMDSVNFIPAESSILTFEPYEINQGSSSYWIYGKDGENYYYFSYDAVAPYLFISKTNVCQGFDPSNFNTWCSAKQGAKK